MSIRKVFMSVLAMLVVTTFVRAQPVPASQPTPARPTTFVEFLTASQNIAIVGTVLQVIEHTRKYEETNGVHGLMPLPVTEVQIRVEYVISGVVDSVVDITADDQGYFAPGQGVGSRVVAWGNRSADDHWRIRGRLGVIQKDGNIFGRQGESVYPIFGSSSPQVTEGQLLSSVQLRQAQPEMLFEGAGAIALVRRVDRSDWTADGAVFTLDSLGWVMGDGAKVPRFLKFGLLSGCVPDIYPSDSLLVPIPPGFHGDTLTIVRCPTSLLVKSGYAPGLGVYLGFDLSRALAKIGNVYRVMHLKQRGE